MGPSSVDRRWRTMAPAACVGSVGAAQRRPRTTAGRELGNNNYSMLFTRWSLDCRSTCKRDVLPSPGQPLPRVGGLGATKIALNSALLLAKSFRPNDQQCGDRTDESFLSVIHFQTSCIPADPMETIGPKNRIHRTSRRPPFGDFFATSGPRRGSRSL